jgi:archaeosine-15-forming tRNA-guanine transglycosylase
MAGELLGVGQTHMNRREALTFERGAAVKVRQGVSSADGEDAAVDG